MQKIFILTLLSFTCGFFTSSFQTVNQVPDGKKLFFKMCAGCHHPVKQLTGNPFQHIREQYSLAEITRFLQDPNKFISTDSTMKLNKRYSGSFKNVAFPDLKEQEVKAILDYVDSFPYDPKSKAYAHRRLSPAQKDSLARIREAKIEKARMEEEKLEAEEE